MTATFDIINDYCKILCTFLIIIHFASCGNDGPNCPGDINLPVEIIPFKVFYNIGDTITISSQFYKLIYDQKTDKLYDVSNYLFTPIISFLSLDSSSDYNVISHVNEDCIYIKQDNSKMFFLDTETEDKIVGEYNFKQDSLSFIVKLKLIKSGHFWIKVQSLTSGDSHLQNNYQFNCRGRYIDFSLQSPKESNIHIMQKFRSIKSNDWILLDSINRFSKHAGYCFEVR